MSSDVAEEVKQVQTEQVEDHIEEHAIICPRCNKNITQADLTVAEDVLKEYTRCLLGQRPFAKTMTLFKGSMQVTFESMSAEQAEIFKATMAEADLDRALDAKLLATLKNIKVIDTATQTSVDTYTADYNSRLSYCKSMPAEVTNVLKNIDAPMLGVLRKCALTFELLCLTIRESVFSEDFYEGVGLL
jgi:hypothetical protein